MSFWVGGWWRHTELHSGWLWRSAAWRRRSHSTPHLSAGSWSQSPQSRAYAAWTETHKQTKFILTVRQAQTNVIMWQEEDAENGPRFSQPWDPPSKVGHGSAAVWCGWFTVKSPDAQLHGHQNQSVLQRVHKLFVDLSLNTCTWTQLVKSWTRWRLNVLVCGLFKNTCRGKEAQHVRKGEPDPTQKAETDNTGKPAGQEAFKPSTKPSQISDSLQAGLCYVVTWPVASPLVPPGGALSSISCHSKQTGADALYFVLCTVHHFLCYNRDFIFPKTGRAAAQQLIRTGSKAERRTEPLTWGATERRNIWARGGPVWTHICLGSETESCEEAHIHRSMLISLRCLINLPAEKRCASVPRRRQRGPTKHRWGLDFSFVHSLTDKNKWLTLWFLKAFFVYSSFSHLSKTFAQYCICVCVT